MLAIIGTVPEDGFPLISGTAIKEEDFLFVNGKRISIQRGTPALVAAACKVFEFFKKPMPIVFVAGDTGKGSGSKKLYEFLINNLKNFNFDVITFHYLFPDADWCNKIMFSIEELSKKPFLIADAGFMYAAKMSGNAKFFDLFTPDPGELAFLADEEAPHPFYTRGFLLQDEEKAPELIERAYKFKNASKYMLVKGKNDYIVKNGKIIKTISHPVVEALEPIGGTGDTITGVVSALIDCGFEPERACILAAKINRVAGSLAKPDPSTQISEIIKFIPEAAKIVLDTPD